jgi:hypothetical protein
MATTWNPSDKDANITLSNGDLTAAATVHADTCVRSTVSKNWGKLYLEFVASAVGNMEGPIVGFGTSQASLTNYVGSDNKAWGYFIGVGDTAAYRYYNGSSVRFGFGNGAAGNTIMLAIDFNLGMIWAGHQGTWQLSGDPAAGTNPIFSGVALAPLFVMADVRFSTLVANFGASSFTYTPPSGFQSWDSDEGNPLREVEARRIAQRVSLHNRYWL